MSSTSPSAPAGGAVSPPRIKIPEEFFETSDLWGARVCLRLLGWPLVLIIALPWLAEISPWLAVATIAPLGIAISKTTLLMHEAMHGKLFRTRALNRIAGRIGGWWTAVDFAAYSALHEHHHARVGAADDPQFRDYGALEGAGRGRLTWHLLRPLLGWNTRHMATLLRQRLRMKRPALDVIGEFAGLALVQGGFAWLATGGGEKPWLALIFPLAAATVGLFISQVRGFCEHVPMPGDAGTMQLRSHISNPIERPFLHYMNYNYHGEHHRYPRVPSRNLPKLSRWLQEQGQPVERSPSYLATLLARWRAAGGCRNDGAEGSTPA